MEIIGGRRFVEVPGEKMHELPPLLVRTSPRMKRLDRVVDMATSLVDTEDIAPDVNHPEYRMDLAIQLAEQYLGFIAHWRWGDSILEWIRQCETTFESRTDLRPLLRPDIWPHAGRSSFVGLIMDKHIQTEGVEVEKAVGLRLTFRQPPPLLCFSDQFLFYLNSPVAASAYRVWSELSPEPISSLPPERFSFEVVTMH